MPPSRSLEPAVCPTGTCLPGGKKRSVVVALLCAGHCSLALLLPLLAVGLTAAGAYLGLPLIWIVPPILISSAFLYVIWPGTREAWLELRTTAARGLPATPHPENES